MNDFERLKGTWIHALPWHSDDYLAEYIISGSDNAPVVEARDFNDGEEFVISNVVWADGILEFKSLMPSTKRLGTNRFSVLDSGKIESKFTFTVIEELERKNE